MSQSSLGVNACPNQPWGSMHVQINHRDPCMSISTIGINVEVQYFGEHKFFNRLKKKFQK